MDALLAGLAIGLFVVAAAGDVAVRRIPNRLVAALAALALARIGWSLALGGAGGDNALTAALADLVAAGALLAVGALLFQRGLLGGGDVKLLAAGALWVGAGALWPFLLITALAGGVLAIGYGLTAAFRPRASAAPVRLPYGVAIAAGGTFATLAAA